MRPRVGLCNFIIPAQGENKIVSSTGTSTSSIQARVGEAYGSVFAFSTGEYSNDCLQRSLEGSGLFWYSSGRGCGIPIMVDKDMSQALIWARRLRMLYKFLRWVSTADRLATAFLAPASATALVTGLVRGTCSHAVPSRPLRLMLNSRQVSRW